MSANLALATTSSVEAARLALDAARHELAALDQRIRAATEELDSREIERERYRVAVRVAVAEQRPIPKAPKLKASEAEVVLPVLHEQRKKLTERVVEREGELRRACVEEVARRYAQATEAFALEAVALIAAWRHLIGTKTLLDASGAGKFTPPLPDALLTDFMLPALGKLRPIGEHHPAHFLASHAIDQGAMAKAVRETRLTVERDIGMVLPW